MLEFFIVVILGLIFGVMVGLMPGLPSYIAPILIFPFIHILSIDQIIVFWLITLLGSQYFGSVAAVLLKIPGDASALIYVERISELDVRQKLELIRQNAWGSTVGTLFATVILFLMYHLGLATNLIFLSNINVKLLLLSLLVFMLCYFSSNRFLSLVMFVFGLMLAEKSNLELPPAILDAQYYFADITIFSIILGLLIIPEFLKEIQKTQTYAVSVDTSNIQKIKKIPLELWTMFKGTTLGSMLGLIPGPSHIMAAITAFNSTNDCSLSKKIIAAESANNSAMTMALLPFFYIGLPITLSEILLYNIFQIKSFTLPTGMLSPWDYFPSINLLELCFVIITITATIYHFLSQSFLKFYASLMLLITGKLKFAYLGLMTYLVFLDISYNPVDLSFYFVWLSIITLFGYWAKDRISTLPLIFGFILGDMIAWTVHQFYTIHFFE